MKLAIIGGRDFNNYDFLKEVMSSIFKKDDIELIISGGAKGADTLGVDYAKEYNIPYIIHDAKWKDLTLEPCRIKRNKYGEYNALAGHNRNTLIINDCDTVLAFWDEKSKGTGDSVSKANKLNKKVIIANYTNGNVR